MRNEKGWREKKRNQKYYACVHAYSTATFLHQTNQILIRTLGSGTMCGTDPSNRCLEDRYRLEP